MRAESRAQNQSDTLPYSVIYRGFKTWVHSRGHLPGQASLAISSIVPLARYTYGRFLPGSHRYPWPPRAVCRWASPPLATNLIAWPSCMPPYYYFSFFASLQAKLTPSAVASPSTAAASGRAACFRTPVAPPSRHRRPTSPAAPKPRSSPAPRPHHQAPGPTRRHHRHHHRAATLQPTF